MLQYIEIFYRKPGFRDKVKVFCWVFPHIAVKVDDEMLLDVVHIIEVKAELGFPSA